MIRPSFKEFSRLAREGNLIPVYQEAYEGLTSMSRLSCFLEADRLTREEIGVIKESRAGRKVDEMARLEGQS